MMDESHKNEVSKSDIQNIYKDIEEMSKDVYALKSKVDDMVELLKNIIKYIKTYSLFSGELQERHAYL